MCTVLPPSPTPSDPVCRICLGPGEKPYRLIRPCRCRGTIALVHPNCLTTWVKMSKNEACQTCMTEFEIEPEGELKNVCDWTYPWPLSQQCQDQADFYFGIMWIIYLFYLGYVYMRTDIYEMRLWMDGHIKFMYSLMLVINAMPSSFYTFKLGRLWRIDNSVYKYMDRSTAAERNDLNIIEIHPFHCQMCPEVCVYGRDMHNL